MLVSEGDSISIFWAGNHTGMYASAHPNVEFHGNAVSGSRITAAVSGNGLLQRRIADLALKPDYVTVFIGANDLGDGTYASPQAWLDALWSYVASIKASGAKVAVATLLPICKPDLPAYTSTNNARRAVVNPAIRQAVGTKIDAVIDFAADPAMGPDAAACDRKWYKDGLHPTEGTGGQSVLARVYTQAVDGMMTK